LALHCLSTVFSLPNRRILFLTPPLAILNALLLGRELVLGPSLWSPRARRIAFAGTAALVGGTLAFYTSHYFGPYRVMAIAARLGRSLNYAQAAGALVSLAVVGSAILGSLLSARLRLAVKLRHQWWIVPA